MWLIVGLGNPGRKYRGTRHNLGFRLVDFLAGRAGIGLERLKHQALIGRGRMFGREVLLAKPQTYMNLSGACVAELLRYWRLTPQDLIVAHDDLDLETGRLRLVAEGGSGGHKGVASIADRLGAPAFIRLKLGIGRPPDPRMDPADFVLSRFGPQEAEEVEAALDRGVLALKTLLTENIEKAQSLYNRPFPPPGPEPGAENN
ncbi:MAG: aminoacyl-tRNA hydrolase [Deltaproteobacteria bacterium]|nr:aminoacyl-tRNA hydrolase [Deltaproteobacteria bacterium]